MIFKPSDHFKICLLAPWRYLAAYFVPLVIMVYSHSNAGATDLSLPQYLLQVQKASFRLEASRSGLVASQSQFGQAQSTTITNVQISPGYRVETTSRPSFSSDQEVNRLLLGGKIQQGFGTGTEAELKLQREWDQTKTASQDLSATSFSLGVSQSLWKNSFGSLTQKKIKAAESQADSSFWQDQVTRQGVCVAAAKLFVQSFIAQQMEKAYSQIEKNSKRVFDQATSLRNRRLIRKADYLAAENDYLEIQVQRLSQKGQLERLFIQLALLTGAQKMIPSILVSPAEQLDQYKDFSLAAFEFKNNPTLRQIAQEVGALEHQVDASQEENRGDLTLGLEGGRSIDQRISLTNGNLEKQESQYVLIGLTLDFPFWNQGIDYNIDRQLALKNQREAQMNAEYRKLRIEQSQLHQQHQENYSKLRLVERQEKLLREQAQIARRDFTNAKISFENYLQVRDRFVRAQINRWDLQSSVWSGGLDQAQGRGSVRELCEPAPSPGGSS